VEELEDNETAREWVRVVSTTEFGQASLRYVVKESSPFELLLLLLCHSSQSFIDPGKVEHDQGVQLDRVVFHLRQSVPLRDQRSQFIDKKRPEH